MRTQLHDVVDADHESFDLRRVIAQGMRWLSLVVAVALIATSCSDDAPSADPDPSALDAELAASAGTGSTTTTSTTTTLRPPVPTDPPERNAPTIGEIDLPCAPVDDNRVEGRPGISPSSITIGTGSDRGGIATVDAGNGIFEMLEVLVDHCNASGGILGRDVVLVDYDAAGTEASDRVATACTDTVALVGHAFLQVIASELAAASCGLPSYPNGAGLQPTTPFPLHGHLAALFIDPALGANVVLVGPDTPTGAAAREKRAAAIAQGAPLLSVVGQVAYPIDVAPDWGRIVGQARALGAGQVHIEGGCAQAVVPFAEIAEAAGWRPVMVATASAYDAACLVSPQADRLLLELPFLPFEDGAAAPAVAEHVALLERVGGEPTGMGLLAASAFWLWASEAQNCLAHGSVGCVGSSVDGRPGWAGAGLHSPIDAGSPACAVVIGIGDDGFERRLPITPGDYDCILERSVTVVQAPAVTETDG